MNAIVGWPPWLPQGSSVAANPSALTSSFLPTSDGAGRLVGAAASSSSPPPPWMIATATALVTLAAASFIHRAMWPLHPKIQESPLWTVIPFMPGQEYASLTYKPDTFPGARDVATPYGSIRVYEWGPESGPKVLFFHGISTSCQTLGDLAHDLVAKGCRVMLFDFFGRGYSDGVGDLPHDARLYTSQALMALASSPLGWTGAAGLRIVGYSMGGGIAVHFAAAFPAMVDRLVLLAPAGLVRPQNFGRATRWLFISGLVPTRLLAAIARVRLRRPMAESRKKEKKKEKKTTTSLDGGLVVHQNSNNKNKNSNNKNKNNKNNSKDHTKVADTDAAASSRGSSDTPTPADSPATSTACLTRSTASSTEERGHLSHHGAASIVDASLTEAADPPPLQPTSLTTAVTPNTNTSTTTAPVGDESLEKRSLRFVQWQVRNHSGFVTAFLSSLSAAPLMGQHTAWRALGAARKKASATLARPGAFLIVLGEDDELVDACQTREDAAALFPDDDDASDDSGSNGGDEGEDYDDHDGGVGGGGGGEGKAKGGVMWATVPGRHNFPMTHPREVLRIIGRAWGMEEEEEEAGGERKGVGAAKEDEKRADLLSRRSAKKGKEVGEVAA